ncbi:histidinol dehydrogenase [Arthrobacter ginsengisoli]|uniref:Histidinol dehydrogenase n=1 Tax=Arthrobacter ginsengisoli TaxID=1356565 RepID=A0ABU1UG30_9MICC|nr:histidinol dehydrogenase [Arthrobacter ginsengisoli]MDR7084137.1 histidinol dehydrogenase [Arthrobacter ginsengisoli]
MSAAAADSPSIPKQAGVERMAACTPSIQAIAARAVDIESQRAPLLAGPAEVLIGRRHDGSLFRRVGTCISYGDKAIGASHVLPTRGAARYTRGLRVGEYRRTVTCRAVTSKESGAFPGVLRGAARVERFGGRARSGDVRAAKYRGAGALWLAHNCGN